MAFNIALSGLKAASNDLKITGNNIANASTTGFKQSRAEFADVYSATILGSGSNNIGSGVKLAEVSQEFEQGPIAFTNNSLDLAIDGEGFFILNNGGTRSYTRAGLFGLDSDGFVVTNNGARLQGFSANEFGTVNGILGDIKIETGNLAPHQTTAVESRLNLNAQSEIKAKFGTTIESRGVEVAQVQIGVAFDSPTTVTSSSNFNGFDFSVNQRAAVTAANGIATRNFGINVPSSITATNTVVGHDFSINSPSTLSASLPPTAFNFLTKSSAVTGTAPTVPQDFLAAGATFDVTIAGGSGPNGNTTVPITLDKTHTNISDLLADINDDLTGIDVTAIESPPGSGAIEFKAAVAGEASTVTIGNYAGAGAANIQAALSGIAEGTSSSGSTFDITIAGGTNNGTATINLNKNISTIGSVLSDIQDQLTASGLSVDVRNDPNNNGRLQFFSTDSGVASVVTVNNFIAGSSDTTTTDLTNVLGVTDGAASNASGAGATGNVGSLTEATFEVHIDGGSGAGGTNRRATITLDQNIPNGDLSSVVSDINQQLSAVASPGIDIRVREDPDNAGLLQFYATESGEASIVTVENFQVSGVAGSDSSALSDITAALGGVVDGSVQSNGLDTSAQFQVRLAGSDTASENKIVTVTLDKNIQTLSDLIADIRDDLVAGGIGIDVREDPTQPGQGKLQFFATSSGENSTITVNASGAATLDLGNGVTQQQVEDTLGGIQVDGSVTNQANGLGHTGQQGLLSAGKFEVTLDGASAGNGTVTITLDTDIVTIDDLIADIQDDLRRAGNIGIDVREDPENAGQVQFFATLAGEESTIVVNNFDVSNSGIQESDLNSGTGVFNFTSTSIAGVKSVDNGYAVQSVDVINSSANPVVTTTVTTVEGESAAEAAARFSQVSGVSANAKTEAIISDFNNNSLDLQVFVNGVRFVSGSLSNLAEDINSSGSLRGITAEFDEIDQTLTLKSSIGQDIVVAIDTTDSLDTLKVAGVGPNINSPQELSIGSNNFAASVGGIVSFILDEGVTLANDTSNGAGLFGSLDDISFTEFKLNAFDPANQETYNSATSVPIFDSLGNPHVMTQYFVKEAVREGETGTTQPNQWTMYVQVDGQDVGDPDTSLPAPDNTLATQAGFKLQFDESGRLLPSDSDFIHITNWSPDQSGDALGPRNKDAGEELPIPDPPTSSNFVIDMAGTTQHGSVFSVDEVDQNGFTTGRLSGLDIGDDGTIFARYTNGENQTLGQVTLANFSNVQGLKNLGGTTWAQTFESGEPVIGTPKSSSLGALNSGALEESNVELSDQLVRLIIAQRNFQANAKTIQTADAITQTIINLR